MRVFPVDLGDFLITYILTFIPVPITVIYHLSVFNIHA